MPNVKFTVAYDGTQYFGWQRTNTGPSIEESLQRVLEQLVQHPVILQAASRTDMGVHAEGQVVNFQCCKSYDWARLQYACNCLLPSDIRVLTVELAEDGFHPTLDNVGKRYEYTICNSLVQLPQHRLYSWHISQRLNLAAMKQAAEALIGEHDFKAFCNQRKNMVYESYIRRVMGLEFLTLPEDRLRIVITGNHFLYKMVRNIVGTLVYIGLGKLAVEDIPRILQSGERPQAGITAPAHGLCLKRIWF